MTCFERLGVRERPLLINRGQQGCLGRRQVGPGSRKIDGLYGGQVCHFSAEPAFSQLFWVLSAFSQPFKIPSLFSAVFEIWPKWLKNITFHKKSSHLSKIYIKYVKAADDAGRLKCKISKRVLDFSLQIIKFLVFW